MATLDLRLLLGLIREVREQRARLLAVLRARIPDAPEPDDSDELARAFARWNAVPCAHHVPGSCDFCPSEDR